MAKVKLVFTEDEVRRIKALEPLDDNCEGPTVELCGNEGAFLEVGIINDNDFPGECDLFVNTWAGDQRERHFINSFSKKELEAWVEYEIFWPWG